MRQAILAAILLALTGSSAWGQGQTGDRVFGQVVRIEISGVVDEIQRDQISRRVPQLMNPGEYTTRFYEGENGLFIARAAPVPDVKAFAAKIDFGRVTGIHDRTIYVRAKSVAGAGTAAASPLNRALEGIKSPSADTRHSALEQLFKMKPTGSRQEVVAALQVPLTGSDPRAKALAIKALGVWSTRGALVPTLLKVIDSRDHRDYGARAEAIALLARFKDPAAIEPLARRLADVTDRRHAAGALVFFGLRAEKATLAALATQDIDTRIAACQVLEKVGGKSSIKPLEPLTKDQNKRLSAAATSALQAVKKRAR